MPYTRRLAILAPQFPVLSETFIGDDMRGMEAAGNRVWPVAFMRGQGAAQPEDKLLAERCTYLDEVAITAFPLCWRPAGWISAGGFLCRQQALPRRSLLYQGLKLAALLRRWRCDHVHAHFAQATAATAIVAARLAGCTVSFVGHGYDVYAQPFDLACKLQAVDAAVAVCATMRQDFLAMAPSAQVRVIPCGVSVDEFQPSEQADNGRLLFIGRLLPSKGIGYVLQALAGMDSASRPALDVVGDGPIRDDLQVFCQQHGLQSTVHWLGQQSRDWIKQQGGRYLALVLPCCIGPDGTRDTGPLVLKEAMAMGLPVVTTDFMGCGDIVVDSCGIKVPVDTVVELAEAIQRLVHSDPAQRQRMGRAGRERVQQYFSRQHQADLMNGLLDDLSGHAVAAAG